MIFDLIFIDFVYFSESDAWDRYTVRGTYVLIMLRTNDLITDDSMHLVILQIITLMTYDLWRLYLLLFTVS